MFSSPAGQPLDRDCAVVELLLARGADPSIKDARYQSTPLGWATHMGRDDVAALLTELSI